MSARKRAEEVDAFELTEPVHDLGPCPPGDQVGLDLGQEAEHLWVDAEHWAADGGVLVAAGRCVGLAAVAQLQLPRAGMLCELLPLGVGDRPGFLLRMNGAAMGHNFIVEDGDVAAGGLQIQCPSGAGADMDGQAVPPTPPPFLS